MRVPNWSAVLAAKIEEWRSRPFAYGTADCFQFVADVVAAQTGVDKRDLFPGYASRFGALRIIASMGGSAGILTYALGEAKPVAHAGRGDVVIDRFSDGIAAAICLGVFCCSPGEKGLVFRSTATAIAAWSV